MIDASSSLVDVAFAVCTALERAGAKAVMTGGSAATYHAPDACQSDDIDFVITLGGAGTALADLLALGYAAQGDFYLHKSSPFPLGFPPGPLTVGDDHIAAWETARRGDEVLHVLSATDSCRDRLAQFLFWNDFSALEQALSVYRARAASIDLVAIRDWCRRERQVDKFDLFSERLRLLGPP